MISAERDGELKQTLAAVSFFLPFSKDLDLAQFRSFYSLIWVFPNSGVSINPQEKTSVYMMYLILTLTASFNNVHVIYLKSTVST